MIPKDPVMNDDERRIAMLLRIIIQQHSTIWCRCRHRASLPEIFASLDSVSPRVDAPASPEMGWHGYRFLEVHGILADCNANELVDGCIVAVPNDSRSRSRVFVVDYSGHILMDRTIAAGVEIGSIGLGRIAVMAPGRASFGRLRYYGNGDACVPSALIGHQWELLPGRGIKEEAFPYACNLAMGLLLIGGAAFDSLALASPSLPKYTGASAIAVGLLVGALGQVWWSKLLWIRNFARWASIISVAILLDLGTILLGLGCAGGVKSTAVSSGLIAGGGAVGGLAIVSLAILLLFWGSSPGGARRLAGPRKGDLDKVD